MKRRILAFSLFAPLLVACGGGAGSGRIHVVGEPAIAEIEPNDASATPHFLGVLHPGERLRVVGHSTDAGHDPFDGFAITLTEPAEIEFRLYADNPHADLDVCVYDPLIDAFALCFESSANPESGVFEVYGGVLDFHLVVSSFQHGSHYTLEVEAWPLPPLLLEQTGPRIRTEAGAEPVLRDLTAERRARRDRELARYRVPALAADRASGRDGRSGPRPALGAEHAVLAAIPLLVAPVGAGSQLLLVPGEGLSLGATH